MLLEFKLFRRLLSPFLPFLIWAFLTLYSCYCDVGKDIFCYRGYTFAIES